MKHVFSYAKAGTWYRPVIPIRLRFKEVEVSYLALLDSGADFNMSHWELAKILRIDVKKLKTPMRFGGIK